jgi:hypothetical protein
MSSASVAAIFLFLGTGCGPSPEQVCDKMAELTKAAAGAAAGQLADNREECLKRENRAKEFKGMLKYGKSRKCLMDAKTLADVKDCDAKK